MSANWRPICPGGWVKVSENIGMAHHILEGEYYPSITTKLALVSCPSRQHDVVSSLARIFAWDISHPSLACWRSQHPWPKRGRLVQSSTMDGNHCIQYVNMTECLHQQLNQRRYFCRCCFDRPDGEGPCLAHLQIALIYVTVYHCGRQQHHRTCRVTLDISGNAIGNQWSSRKYPE